MRMVLRVHDCRRSMTHRSSFHRKLPRIGEDSALRREAVTMGFYTCVTLFAALAVGDDSAAPQPAELVALIWISTVGLALAHWFAATIAIQLVRDEHAHHSTAEYVLAHLLIPAVAAASTSLVVLIVPDDVKMLSGRLTAAALLALLVHSESRRGGASPLRSVRLAVLAFGCAAGIAVLKRLLF
ncbi:MAG: hypothetical protein IPM45_03980 [Acidimicrobiales bacterium]|nr:hypothetical protein [Acidimicrobiales bacterium]